MGEILQNVQPHDIMKYGLIPELVGRLPVITPLHGLDRDNLIQILTQPKNSLTRQYQALMRYDNVDLSFTQDALEAVADQALEMDLGARGLRSIMERVMQEIMYTIPSDHEITAVEINGDCIRGTAGPVITRRKPELAG